MERLVSDKPRIRAYITQVISDDVIKEVSTIEGVKAARFMVEAYKNRAEALAKAGQDLTSTLESV